MSERCVVDGVALEVQRIGDGARPTLVFLHEGLGSVTAWRDFPERVVRATSCPAVVYSRAGYGQSDPVTLPRPLSYMQDEAMRVLPVLLDVTGVDDAVLVGHSDGASIALVYAATPHGKQRVRGLVLEAPHVFCEPRSVDAIARAKQQYLHGDLRERLARHHANVDIAFWGWNDAWLDPRFRRWNIESFLPDIRAPALVIQSTDDPYGTGAQVEAIATSSGGPVETLLLDDCGHAPHRDRPDETLTAITHFIDTHARQPNP